MDGAVDLDAGMHLQIDEEAFLHTFVAIDKSMSRIALIRIREAISMNAKLFY